MKTVVITEDFVGYPQGAKEGSEAQSFTKGQEVEVNATFADLIIDKGQAREKASSAPELAATETGSKGATTKRDTK
jgi:hypothetical protein